MNTTLRLPKMDSMTKWVDIESYRDGFHPLSPFVPYCLGGFRHPQNQLGIDFSGWGRQRGVLISIARQYHEHGFPLGTYWFREYYFRHPHITEHLELFGKDILNKLRPETELIHEYGYFEDMSGVLSKNNIAASSFMVRHLTRMHRDAERKLAEDRKRIREMSPDEKERLAREKERYERMRQARASGEVICPFCDRMWGPLRNKAGKIMRSDDVYVICHDCEEDRR